MILRTKVRDLLNSPGFPVVLLLYKVVDKEFL